MISYYATSNWPYHVSSGGVVLKDDEILLLVRNDQSGKTYHLPKGTLEPGESLEACARREILEESGAEVELQFYLGARTQEYGFRNRDYSKTTHYFLAKLKSQQLKPMDLEHSGREWVGISNAKNLLKLNDNPKQEWLIIERVERYLSSLKDK
jgi:8-oxo-dGTP pyrophosphatase MutT (NUDIX family)